MKQCYWCSEEATRIVVIEPGRPATVKGRKGYKPPRTVDACETHGTKAAVMEALKGGEKTGVELGKEVGGAHLERMLEMLYMKGELNRRAGRGTYLYWLP